MIGLTNFQVTISNVTIENRTNQVKIPSAAPPAWSPPKFNLATPFAVGVDADPLFSRKGGGKPNPMEDVAHCEWPLRGHNDVRTVVHRLIGNLTMTKVLTDIPI